MYLKVTIFLIKFIFCRHPVDIVSRKPYRPEILYSKNRSPKCYIVKDVIFEGKRRKVRKYLCSGHIPTQEEFDEYREKYGFYLENRAAEKIGEWSIGKFKTRYLSDETIKTLEQIKYLHKRFTELLTTNELEVYEKNFEITYIQGTTSIEGNTFTLQEARDFLINGMVPKDKKIREINEIQNFKNVKKYRDTYRKKVTLEFIKHLHSLIMEHIDDQSAGSFRRSDDTVITGCNERICPSVAIEDQLQTIINEYYENLINGHHPVEAAILFHYQFEITHPFTDGNGRVGREIFNFMLKSSKYPKLLFLGGDRDAYIDALRLGNLEKYNEMVEIFTNIIIKQRFEILIQNLKQVVIPPKKRGQVTLSEFS